MDRWTNSEAWAWWDAQPWICGFNYLPSSAVNFLEFWHADSFDPDTIARELGWAAEAGFNAMRFNLHSLIWEHDRDGLLDRVDRVMQIAADAGLSSVPCLFDDCGFGGAEPVFGPQPDPVPGVHNSRAVASPGREAVMDPARRPALERYVRDVLRQFRDDPRVLFWDLYNEPGNRMIFRDGGYAQFDGPLDSYSLQLMKDSFAWARAENPRQPLTVGAWTTPQPGETVPPYQTEIDRAALALSDVLTFHAYWDAAHVAQFIDHLAAHDRPMLCTEWMARAVDSRIADQLPLFHDRGVGCFQWGLVRGRTQTHLPWPEALVRDHGGQTDKDIWFHDLFDEDGRPYDPAEIETIRTLTGVVDSMQRKGLA